MTQSRNLRDAEMSSNSIYNAKNDLVELNLRWQLSDTLTATSLTSYSKDYSFSRYDQQLYVPILTFNSTALFPGGFVNDPQIGASNKPRQESIYITSKRQWTQELRLQSSFDGPVNFNAGGIYIDFKGPSDIILMNNLYTANTVVLNAGGRGAYIDPLQNPDGTGTTTIRATCPIA